MKKIIIALILAVLLPASAWGAGTCTPSFTRIYNSEGWTGLAVLTYTCTADAAAATFPSTSTDTADSDGVYFTDKIKGYHIVEVRTNPGTTAPTDNYDIVINDHNGIDLMGGQLANRDTTTSEAAYPAIAAGIPWPRPIDGAITPVITGNNVNSAVTVIKIFLER